MVQSGAHNNIISWGCGRREHTTTEDEVGLVPWSRMVTNQRGQTEGLGKRDDASKRDGGEVRAVRRRRSSGVCEL